MDARGEAGTARRGPGGPRRYREQRWLIDEAIRTSGIEWDQPRLGYSLGPVGPSGVADAAMARLRIHKLADATPVFRGLADRREQLAEQARAADHPVSAREHLFAAALLYTLAAWPIVETTDLLLELEERKNACYAAWGELADHRVERVEIPFAGRALPGWLHLPPGFDGTPVPAVLACGGMDSPKETCVAQAGDAYLARGLAVLAVDGPGQAEAASRGLHVTPDAWVEAGAAFIQALTARPELDATRLVCTGVSFGSHWMTQVAATQPGFVGCAVALPVFEPGCRTLFEQASPTFKARHMWMAGLADDEAAFDRLAAGYDLERHVTGMSTPWLVVAGGADELSPVEHAERLVTRHPGPASLVVYQGARHALTEAPSVLAGPPWRMLMTDWLADRAQGRPAPDDIRRVTPDGKVTTHPRQP